MSVTFVPAASAGASRPGRVLEDGELRVTQVDAPDPVSSNNDVSYVVTVRQEGEGADKGGEGEDVTLTDVLPAGSVFVSASPSQGSCMEEQAVVTCDLGELGEEDAASVEIIVAVPAVTHQTIITNTADAQGGEGSGPRHEGGSSTEETTVLAPNQDLTIGFVPSTGLVLDSDLGGGATHDNPTTTRMLIPAGREGVASIAEVPGVPTDCPHPFTCFGQRIDLSAPEAYGAPRLRMAFTFDASSLPPWIQLKDVRMFRDGVLVPMCLSPDYADPCVQRKKFVGGGDLRIWVCTSETSGWRGGQ